MAAVLPDHVASGAIVLRRRRVADVPELSAAIDGSIAELGAFVGWAAQGLPSRAPLEHTVAAWETAFDAGTGFAYVVRESATGELVGEAGGDLGNDAVEIGYWIRSDRTGRGYGTAAASALTSLCFDAFPNVGQVEIRMDKGNVRSLAIARRLGFAHVGDETFAGERLRGQTGEGHIYAMARARWRPVGPDGVPK